MSAVLLDISLPIATITLNRPKSYNALTRDDYDALANFLREVDKNPDVLVTIVQGNGKWFCSGTNVRDRGDDGDGGLAKYSVRGALLGGVARTSIDCGQALYSHSKILVAAMNGPVMGIAAAFLGHFDFVYCMPEAFLSIPFSFLGIVAEAGSSVSFVNKMGLGKANETLLFGQTQDAESLLACGFVNKIFPTQSCESFQSAVRAYVLDQVTRLDPDALLEIKRLIQAGVQEKNNPDAVNLREAYAQASRFASGKPLERFVAIATGQVKHRL
ncbi:ClpP/crotonase-like domain-containing protein [Flagelloscypha sp. PMI_526]|nr:ClpP/crotonase-like domain-containing protein [Flagelloscypha sp. PMI_526]